jgi:AcrR family transcriptional regulator
MPRAFTDSERDAIRERLLSSGQDLFSQRGIRATTVDQLARAAGISKGAFYLFYDSKEALFFELVERIETGLQERLEAQVAEAPHDAVRLLLWASLTARDENPLFDLATSEEAVAVMRTMSPAEQEAFLRRDIDMTAAISERLTASGIRLTVSPAVLTGLLRAMVFIGMHREDIGAEMAPSVQAFLVDSLARALTKSDAPGGAS